MKNEQEKRRMDQQESGRSGLKYFLQHGGAGVLASVLIILIFLICATWLKSLVFGVLISCLLLPLERFFEEKVFKIRKKSPGKRWFNFRFSKKELSPEEAAVKEQQSQIFKSSLAAMLTLIVLITAVVFLATAFLIPQAAKAKQHLSEWGKNSPAIEKVERYLLEHGKESAEGSADGNVIQTIRKNLRELAEENKETLASFAVARGKDLFTVVYRFLKGLGLLFFDVILAIFFGFYFLQKIAFFEGAGSRRRSRTGEWFVDLFFNSPWLPAVSRRTKWQTVRIMTHIGGILTRWVRGYFTVISSEMLLYILLFTAAGVPYALLAGIVAGLTVLLPFIGPMISFCLTAGLCLVFCESSLLLTLIFVTVIYFLINGLLEQFFLYPACIGEVSGLTTVETIIVVLIGGIAAGISGMIFAIPAAAVIKYLVPVIYRATSYSSGKTGQ